MGQEMSGKIPFLEMFAALRARPDVARAVEGWRILSASVDRAKRRIEVAAEVDCGAPEELLADLERAMTELYRLSGFALTLEYPEPERDDTPPPPGDEMAPPEAFAPGGTQPGSEPPAREETREPGAEPPAAEEKDAFAVTEAYRRQALSSLKSAEIGPRTKKGKVLYGHGVKKAPVPVGKLALDMGTVAVEGDVFSVDHRELKKRKAWVAAFDLTDYTGSIRVSKFCPGDEGKPIVDGVKEGAHVLVQGRLSMDRFYGDMVLEPASIQTVPKPVRRDDAGEKRVELHLHTKLSAMDALTDTAAAVRRAEEWGHSAIAITDHGVAQAFPDAWHAASKLKVIYGVEAYYINNVDDRIVVHGPADASFQDEIVCFDLETTGLNRRTEAITEIGAVVLRGGEVCERFQTFADPGRPLSAEIVNLTGIDDGMLRDAPSQEEALRAFVDFVAGRPVAAHNAEFDMGFVREGCAKYGIPFSATSLDTLILAQDLLPELGKYRLDAVAEYLKLPAFRHHRADDDAAAVAYMLIPFFRMLEERGVHSIQEINGAMRRLRPNGKARRQPRHLIVLAKNQTGLRNLYRLISLSHLEHFKRYPIMPKSLIDENREGLILGSACAAGELFDAVVKDKSWDELKRIASWYDYLEIQPVCNNRYLLRRGTVNTEEELREFNRTVVRLGRELGKPVCATGDVHFLDPEDEIYRHILLSSREFEDACESLPVYLRTTQEMLEEFSYLGEETAREVVVAGPNLVADWCDRIEPLPRGLFPPKLEHSDTELRDLVWSRARALYGENLPSVVEDRLNAELSDIIRCRYDVIYMSAQKLVQDSLDHGYLVGSRGSVGSSLVAYMAGITEVNALPAHYRCPKCGHADFEYAADPAHPYGCGADMPDGVCPVCGAAYEKDGFNIPFETFLGFGGDKVPDIDLNFSGFYQAKAHRHTFELFGEDHVFRAGTIGTVAEKTAFGYVKHYCEKQGITVSKAEENRLALGCTGVKRTTGQHPGGMVVIPQDTEIYDFCPIQHPADDPDSGIITTHFEYHAMEENLLKLDMLGHDDPSMIRMLEDLTGQDARAIPLDDPRTMSLFTSSKELGYENDPILGPTGAVAIPEFNTRFARGMLEETQPRQFEILLRLCGFAHGTDVWLGNARDLILEQGVAVGDAIGCRDDIMTYLISRGFAPKRAFKIMESVRKGRGLPEGAEQEMKEHGVPDWYIGSCRKIKYLFPRAHAVAYVMMAFRIAWYKVHCPLAFYAAYFTIRAKAFDESCMCRGMEKAKQKMREITAKDKSATEVEKDMLTTLEVVYEFYLRGFTFERLDLYRSDAVAFQMNEAGTALIPPFVSVTGLGEAAAEYIVEAREGRKFISIEEFADTCSKVSRNQVELLRQAGAFGRMPDTSQMDLFSLFG